MTDVRRLTDVMSSLLNRVRKYVTRFHENSTYRKFRTMAVSVQYYKWHQVSLAILKRHKKVRMS